MSNNNNTKQLSQNTQQSNQSNQSDNNNNNNQSTDDESKEPDNCVWVSSSRSSEFFHKIAINMFRSYDQVEVRGLGNASSTSVDVAEKLKALGATVEKIHTSAIPGPNGRALKHQIIIVLNKGKLVPPTIESTTTTNNSSSSTSTSNNNSSQSS